jgi:CheY-like chemotaxis protein
MPRSSDLGAASMADSETTARIPEYIQLLNTLVWPIFGVFVILIVRKPLSALLGSSAVSEVDVGGVKVTFSQLKSAVAAGAAVGSQSDATPQDTEKAVDNIARAFVDDDKPAKNRDVRARPVQRKILWVDDIPSNNSSLVRAFRDLDIAVTEVLSTEEGIQKAASERFDIVISDMGRPEGGEAGLDLVKRLRAAGAATPIIIFAAGWARGHRGEEAKYGVAKITNDADVVYTTVLNLIGAAAR